MIFSSIGVGMSRGPHNCLPVLLVVIHPQEMANLVDSHLVQIDCPSLQPASVSIHPRFIVIEVEISLFWVVLGRVDLRCS